MMDDDGKKPFWASDGGMSMADFWACVIDEIRALGAWCMIHGPEIWLGLVAWCVLSIAVVIGMWLGALLGANREDNDEHKNDL